MESTVVDHVELAIAARTKADIYKPAERVRELSNVEDKKRRRKLRAQEKRRREELKEKEVGVAMPRLCKGISRFTSAFRPNLAFSAVTR